MNHKVVAPLVTGAVVVVFFAWVFGTTFFRKVGSALPKTYDHATLCETPGTYNGESTHFWREDAGAAFEACHKRLEQAKELDPVRYPHLYCVPSYRCE